MKKLSRRPNNIKSFQVADSILIRFWFNFITHKRQTCMSRIDMTAYERAEWHTRAHSVHSLVEAGETGALWGRWRDEWRRRWMSLRHHQKGKCAACATSRRSLFKQTWCKFPCVFYGGLSFCKSLPFITVFCLDGHHFPPLYSKHTPAERALVTRQTQKAQTT